MITDAEIIKVIRSCAESQADKWLQSVLEKGKSKSHLYAAMWLSGKPAKESSDLGKLMHRLTYHYFSEKIVNEIETGKISINQARAGVGLSPLPDPVFDIEIFKANDIRFCPRKCDFEPVEHSDKYCGKCGSELDLKA